MSLLKLNLKITPTISSWVGNVRIVETSAGKHTQQELAQRMKMTGDEVTSALADLDFRPVGASNNWVYAYEFSVETRNREINLLKLKSSTVALLEYMASIGVPLYVHITMLEKEIALGWYPDRREQVLEGVNQWNG